MRNGIFRYSLITSCVFAGFLVSDVSFAEENFIEGVKTVTTLNQAEKYFQEVIIGEKTVKNETVNMYSVPYITYGNNPKKYNIIHKSDDKILFNKKPDRIIELREAIEKENSARKLSQNANHQSINSAPKNNRSDYIKKGTHCPAEKDKPGWSSRKNKNHMDEDCCADYDEWPKPGCAYTSADFKIMLDGPTKGHIKNKH
ncbi:MAG TPA: hypothetical protein P5548_02480 [Candidatus Moranbacteria bacterium]|nr:hypothetical protein [Candidatus Moranbacteria bacterium]HRZ33734.1 hypothetical protein [Candidatus Moranbacteria bacterium]